MSVIFMVNEQMFNSFALPKRITVLIEAIEQTIRDLINIISCQTDKKDIDSTPMMVSMKNTNMARMVFSCKHFRLD